MNARLNAAKARQEIYSDVCRSIREGQFGAGSKLPTERELASTYGAGRGAVRSALGDLVRDGHIERHVGRGSFIAPDSPATDNPATEEQFTLDELLEARLVIEPALASIIVARATEADFAQMEVYLDQMRQSETWIRYKESIYSLHFTIIRVTRNRFLVRLFEMIIEARRGSSWGVREVEMPVPPEVRDASVAENRKIIDAIQAKSVERTQDALRKYLSNILMSLRGI